MRLLLLRIAGISIRRLKLSISLVPITWSPPKAASHLLIFLLYPSHRPRGSAAPPQ